MQAKRLGLLRELVPTATRVALFINPANPVNTETTLKDVEAAARTMGLAIQVVRGSTPREIDEVFATLGRERPDALFVGGEELFIRRVPNLPHPGGARHAIPSSVSSRDLVAAGGLISYGTNPTDTWRQVGVYVGRISQGGQARGPAGSAGVEVRA